MPEDEYLTSNSIRLVLSWQQDQPKTLQERKRKKKRNNHIV